MCRLVTASRSGRIRTCVVFGVVDTDRRNERTNSDFVSLLRSSASPPTYNH